MLIFGLPCPNSKPAETSKRVSNFTAVRQLGSVFAGIIMTAVPMILDGRVGMDGWYSATGVHCLGVNKQRIAAASIDVF